ncbi:MAG TPA: hypothetical protein VJ625_05595 [Propionibacteriaceae bacterium]|nr:hypothetical protein [Propionibacteriaceae bacterium]
MDPPDRSWASFLPNPLTLIMPQQLEYSVALPCAFLPTAWNEEMHNLLDVAA